VPVTTDRPHVLLLYPKTGLDFGSTVAPPHALLAVAAPLLKHGYRVQILDQRTQPITEAVLREALSGDPICVGISSMTGAQIYFALGLAQMVRRITDGRVPIVWGGCHPSVMPEQTLEHPLVDIVVNGEGDLSLLDLVETLEHQRPLIKVKGILYKDGGKIVKTLPRPLMNVEELLPTPWELVDPEAYIHRDMYLRDRHRVLDIGQTSRGCPFDCGFCSSASIRERKWRAMSVDRTVDMIAESVARFRLDGFWLRDDEFYINRKRAHAVFERMIREGLNVSFYTSGTRCDVFGKASEDEVAVMKRAGAHTLKFGAESGSQRILDLMQKGITVDQTIRANLRCKQHGITPAFSLMIGYPTETFDDMNLTIDLAYRIKRDNPQAELETMATYTALPGTPDFQLALQHGLEPPGDLEAWMNWNFHEYDLDGRRIPWFASRTERRWVGNINIMSILANALPNLAVSARNPAVRLAAQAVIGPVSAYYRFRLKNKMYKTVPELALISFLREKVFYKGTYTFK
jgi:radical SAM superfamily enzyme YgiQ (UPF0313 family)